jgi:transcriptional regulator with PAS, ATPase and Fis domain
LREEVTRLRRELRQQYNFDNIVGISRKMKEVYERIAAAADSDSTILIQGESGTGKDLIARSIHYNSVRSKEPFIALNCASIPANLIESELFGYKKGAFTGASADAIGILRSADRGTLFLDEIGDMPLGVQARLLRFLENKKVRPVGGVEETKVDVRVICATNQDLEVLVAENKFRKDLYYRISIIIINLPPLRERREDIPLLIDHFISKYNRDIRTRQVMGISKDAVEVLKNYEWDGNVRELENVIRRAFVLGKNPIITLEDLPEYLRKSVALEKPSSSDIRPLSEVEREMIQKALRTIKNKTEVAKKLGISRKRLYNLIERYRIKI